MATVSQRKPKTRKTTLKTLVDHFSRALPPESKEPEYEFDNGNKTKKPNGGPYDGVSSE